MSQVYGLAPGRSWRGGELQDGEEGMLPSGGAPCHVEAGHCFASGDNRTNELPGLTLYHLLWHRSHSLGTALPDLGLSPDGFLGW